MRTCQLCNGEMKPRVNGVLISLKNVRYDENHMIVLDVGDTKLRVTPEQYIDKEYECLFKNKHEFDKFMVCTTCPYSERIN